MIRRDLVFEKGGPPQAKRKRGSAQPSERIYRAEALRDRVARVTRADRALVVRDRDEDLRGLPPSNPFLRDDAAFRLDLTEPRHAGQNETKSILWI
jgi:hypothetical protein